MKKFIYKILLYSCIVIAILFIYEILLEVRPNEFSYKKEYIETNRKQIKTLILGHSQLEQGLIPSILGDSIFNFAIEGRSNYYDTELLKKYISTLPNLKCVIWPLSYNFQYYKKNIGISDLFKGKEGMENTYRCMYYKYMDIPCGKYSFLFWSEILNSKYEFAKRFFTNDKKILTRCDSLGFHSNGKHNPALMNQTLPKEVNYDDPQAQEALKAGMNNIMTIARLCKTYHIRLIVISPPTYKNYQSLITSKGLNSMKNVIKSMTRCYPNLEYKNYIFDQRFDIEDFYNSSHLSEKGAEKFSQIFKNDFLL